MTTSTPNSTGNTDDNMNKENSNADNDNEYGGGTAGGDGYTPFNDFNDDDDNGGTEVAFSPMPQYAMLSQEGNFDIQEDDGSEGGGIQYTAFCAGPDDDNNDGTGGTTHFMQIPGTNNNDNDDNEPGLFYANPLAFNNGKKNEHNDELNDEAFDFKAIAEQALKSIEDDYYSTINAPSSTAAATIDVNKEEEREEEKPITSTSPTPSETVEEPTSSPTIAPPAPAPASTIASVTKSFNTTSSTGTGSSNSIKPIDTKAIAKAMQKIRLKAPTLTAKLDDWDPSSSKLTSNINTATASSTSNPNNQDNFDISLFQDTPIPQSQIDDDDDDKNESRIDDTPVSDSTTTTTNDPSHNPYQHHPIIPSIPLQEFSSTTKISSRSGVNDDLKSIQSQNVTANLTRSATLAEAFHRLFLPYPYSTSSPSPTPTPTPTTLLPLLKLPTPPKTTTTSSSSLQPFVIHIVGADYVECEKESTIRKALRSFVRWLDLFLQKIRFEQHEQQSKTDDCGATATAGILSVDILNHVEIVLLGPNVPMEAEEFSKINMMGAGTGIEIDSATNGNGQKKKKNSSMSGGGGGMHSCFAICRNVVYHDYLHDIVQSKNNDDNDERSWPHLAISYNAGIWGYEEWKPTLQSICAFPRPIPFIVTSYTLDEAEEDFDIIEDVVKEANDHNNYDDSKTTKVNNNRCLWEEEVNPFASQKVRDTATAPNGQVYFENGAWQCWLLGREGCSQE